MIATIGQNIAKACVLRRIKGRGGGEHALDVLLDLRHGELATSREDEIGIITMATNRGA